MEKFLIKLLLDDSEDILRFLPLYLTMFQTISFIKKKMLRNCSRRKKNMKIAITMDDRRYKK